jgi:hypothetical protein
MACEIGSGVALIWGARGDPEPASPLQFDVLQGRSFHRLDGPEANRRPNAGVTTWQPSQLTQWVGSIASCAFAILRMTPEHMPYEPIRIRPLLAYLGTNHPRLLF